MGRHCKPIEESLRWEIYLEFRRWSEQHNTICNPHSFWRRVLPERGYRMAQSTFRREWDRLVKEDRLIAIEPVTLSPIIADLRLVDSALARLARDVLSG